MKKIHGKTKDEWLKELPILQDISERKECYWVNHPNPLLHLDCSKIDEAEERLNRFAPYLAHKFPETKAQSGLIESPLVRVQHMQDRLEQLHNQAIAGKLFLKCDHALAISGSVKARGGIYEVLKLAEQLAVQQGLLKITDDYSKIDSSIFRSFYSRYTIIVGSTGNLGLSIGLIGRTLGFQVNVHMSSDAKQWKKDLLRKRGVNVVEHGSDYGEAVKQGRMEAEKSPLCHFIDDEKSADLFFGYATAARRLKNQLKDLGVQIDEKHPLFIYLPCGVGGAPGGIAYGLRQEFGKHVHLTFAEPVESPCFLLGMATKLYSSVSVHDFGLTNRTAADGLAVGRPSELSSQYMINCLNASFTVSDTRIYRYLAELMDTEGIYAEPSALTGFYGPFLSSKEYDLPETAVHVIWSTGGNMVPLEVREADYRTGKGVLLNP
ncbi:D-serine ammonia-lyase [Gracilibacillus sp. Marseille-QA3620]